MDGNGGGRERHVPAPCKRIDRRHVETRVYTCTHESPYTPGAGAYEGKHPVRRHDEDRLVGPLRHEQKRANMEEEVLHHIAKTSNQRLSTQHASLAQHSKNHTIHTRLRIRVRQSSPRCVSCSLRMTISSSLALLHPKAPVRGAERLLSNIPSRPDYEQLPQCKWRYVPSSCLTRLAVSVLLTRLAGVRLATRSAGGISSTGMEKRKSANVDLTSEPPGNTGHAIPSVYTDAPPGCVRGYAEGG